MNSYLKIAFMAILSTLATTSTVLSSSISSDARGLDLGVEKIRRNPQLIAQSCRNTDLRTNGRQNLSFRKGDKWVTCNNYKLEFQGDGNLVLYSPSGNPIWATGTEGRGSLFSVQTDGNVVLYDSSNRPLWASDTSGNIGAFFSIQTDGNLVVYRQDGRPGWNSATDGGRSRTRSASSEWISSKSTPPANSTSASGDIDLPFASSSTWYVCQGYDGPISHKGYYAFDLSVGQDYGSNNSCWAGDGNTSRSRDQQVLSPSDGTIVWVDQDMACVKIDERRAIMLGHMNVSVRTGQQVKRGSVLGTLTKAGVARNGGFSHIHVEARQSSTCKSGTSVPFTKENGFQFRGVGDLPAGQTHWKRSLRRE